MPRQDTADAAHTDETAPNLHEMARGRADLLDPAQDVVDVEEEAASTEVHSTPDRVRAWLFRADVSAASISLAKIPSLVAHDENFVWIDLDDLRREDLQNIAHLLHLDPAAVETAVAQWEHPQLHRFGDHFFVSVTVPQLVPEARRVQAAQLDLFVGRNYLVTAHKSPLPFAERIMARAAHNPALVQYDSAFMLYLILDELLTYDDDLQHEISAEVERMEERALQSISERFLSDLLDFKRYLYALNALISQHRPILRTFLRPDFSWVDRDEVEVYFRDLDSRFRDLLDALSTDAEAVNSAFGIYVSHVSHRTNKIIKVLTIVSTIVLPISVIVGVFATTFQGVPVLHTPTGFDLMLIAMALVPIIALGLFRYRRWI